MTLFSSFRIDSIEPSEQNARSIVSLTNADLLRAGLSETAARDFADVDNDAHIERQVAKLATHPEQYLGAIAVNELIGFVKYAEWNRADQVPFVPGVIKPLAQRALFKSGDIHLEGLPQGIHGLVVDGADIYARFVGMYLLKDALSLAGGHETRVARYEGDPMNYVIRENGFIPTGKRGNVLGINQELYVRPATPRDSAAR